MEACMETNDDEYLDIQETLFYFFYWEILI